MTLTKYKDGNPKTALGIRKPSTFYTPYAPYMEYSLVHMQGAFKYGHFNWLDDPVSISTYTDAALRHIALYLGGQRNASDTGLHHLAHAMTCLSIVIDAEVHNTLIDDRFKHRNTEINEGQIASNLEQYIESCAPRIAQIYDQWYGYAEKNAHKYTDESGAQ